LDLIEQDGANGGATAEVEDEFIDELVFVDDAAAFFDAEDGSFAEAAGGGDGYFGAAELLEQLGEGRVLGDVDLKACEGAIEGGGIGVADRADLAAIEIFEEQGFENVVNLIGFEVEGGLAISVDGAGVFEVADAAGEERNLLDGDVGLI